VYDDRYQKKQYLLIHIFIYSLGCAYKGMAIFAVCAKKTQSPKLIFNRVWKLNVSLRTAYKDIEAHDFL